MEVKVYIDVLFLVNLIMNYILLWFTGLFAKIELKFWRMALASAVGAIYAAAVFFIPLTFFYGILTKLVLGCLMVLLGCKPSSIRHFLKELCVFGAVTFATGGIGFAFFYFTNVGSILGAVYANGVLYLNLPAYLLVFLCAVCYIVLNLAFGFVKKIRRKHRLIFDICLMLGGKTVHLRGLYDTGNFLKETISGKSVMIAEWNRVRSLFGKSKTLLDAVSADAAPFIPITYTGLGGQDVLFAFLPDEIYMADTKLTRLSPVYVGIVDRKLDKSNDYNLILPNDFEGADFDDGGPYQGHFTDGENAVLQHKSMAGGG